jgi:hypothetical protein
LNRNEIILNWGKLWIALFLQQTSNNPITMYRTFNRKNTWHASLILMFLFTLSYKKAEAQTIFVDALNGKDNAKGSMQDPLASIEKAVSIANNFEGAQPIIIKLSPGLYLLKDQLLLKTLKANSSYSIEATIMPDDPSWQPSKMPVIQSVSTNNKNWGNFDHCTGIQVERNNTSFKGLKFVGNSNPGIVYYYAIERHFPELKGMEISQCMFVGNRNAAPIQGAIFAQGSDISVDHCIFYECKNALLLFLSVTGFKLTNSIIYGSYEGAIWFGKYSEFLFSNNIIANNNCFWISMKDFVPKYAFSNSLITNNKIFLGLNNNGTIDKDNKNVPLVKNVQRSGTVTLNIVTTDTIPNDYMHLSPNSAGKNIQAGIFKIPKNR